MTVQPLDVLGVRPPSSDDAPLPRAAASAGASFATALGDAFREVETALVRADGAERAFAARRGGLQEMVLQRAQADVTLSIASSAASRTTQALTTILGMQV